ncbi:hypothetical protein [Streptomyces sp. DT195]|uniref:hypothetical protein n=1 Tax=Streptomyces sp. DT195 TaxID=3393419 RepID=UPI003CEFAFF3
MPSHYDALPDLAFGHHPNYGIVAANPKNLAASTWMLERLDFHPVPDQPTLYALAHQERDGQGRTTRAVELLRKSGYQVDVDAAFSPSLAPDAARVRGQVPLGKPEVAFAEHPQLGFIAAINDRASGPTGLALLQRGWQYDPSLDIYALPATTGRSAALGKVADAALALHLSGVPVVVHSHLARDVAARSRPAPVAVVSRERGQSTPRASPISAAALATSPARGGLTGEAPIPTPIAPAAAVRPADPRIAFSRDR